MGEAEGATAAISRSENRNSQILGNGEARRRLRIQMSWFEMKHNIATIATLIWQQCFSSVKRRGQSGCSC
ncbi:Hypothetical protein GbCGDNIH2_1388 [Granulibacter bethesdensis]|uniref:Uncharacterized protein n=1 Tax=Granulibacter bethesdensis (strain ATCC BAA-1260 / CGDNIH1) TaxID=391165 RepID=Q0BSB6_GRABC|nr:Hypothetical protein GbCGDNIH1_1388 [Granulibacter bethesdensis CGDNIH1]APG30665.1 Hypothetical protein GbCGDNIH2_1388 [Granulibacter bethesdensis]APH52113.1 Hypothetical protein GbCGDNIH5_1388 [Granulibacter bethesdensis]APH64804.1 Hypothetical protein GbCGDNIH1I4_1388 [Granulibacter bethesdensis]